MARRTQPPAPGPVDAALRSLLTASALARVALARRLGMGLRDVEAMEHVMLAAAPAERTGRREQPLGPVELSRRLGVTSAASTQALHRLERDGHVQRVAHSVDGRRRTLAVTASGRAHVMSQLGPMLEALGTVSSELNDAEAEVVTRYLQRVTEVFERYTSDVADGT